MIRGIDDALRIVQNTGGLLLVRRRRNFANIGGFFQVRRGRGLQRLPRHERLVGRRGLFYVKAFMNTISF